MRDKLDAMQVSGSADDTAFDDTAIDGATTAFDAATSIGIAIRYTSRDRDHCRWKN